MKFRVHLSMFLLLTLLVIAASSIPGRSLAQTNLFTVLTPLPGDETIGPAAVAQLAPHLSRGDDTLLAVWSDRRSSPANTGEQYETANDIYAMRLDANGIPLDTVSIVITQAPGNQDRPQASWNGSHWLVVFETTRISGTGGYYEQSLAAVRVAPDGQVLDSTPISIYNTVPNIGTWAVASDGNGWVVAFQGSAAGQSVQAIRILSTGQVLQPAVTLVPETYYLRFNFHLAYANGVFLLTWADTANTMAVRFDSALNLLDTVPVEIVPDSGFIALASNGSQFYVTWLKQQPDFSLDLTGTRITTDGVRLDEPGVNISGSNQPDPNAATTVSWDGQNWQASWGYNGAVSVARITSEGLLLDPGGISVSGPETGLSAGDGNGGIHLIWTPYVDSQYDIVTAHISNTQSAGPNRIISTGAPLQFAADFAVGDNGYMAVYRSDTASAHRIHIHPLDSDGVPITAEPIELASGDIIFGPGQPSVAWNGSLYLVTWANSSGIVAQRVQQDGTLVDISPFLVINTAIGPTDVAAVGDTFLVMGRKYGTYPQYLYPVAARVRGSDGAVLDAAPLYVGESYARTVAVTAFGDRWLTVWFSTYTHDNSVGSTAGNFVSTTGSLGTSFSIHGPYSMGGNGIIEVAAASNGVKALVLQSVETTSGVETDLIGRLLDTSGNVEAAINLTPWAGNQYRPRVAWDGSQYVAAYTEQKNRFAPWTADQLDARGDLFGMRIAADGEIIDPQGFAFSISPIAETHPNVIAENGVSLLSGSVIRNESPYAALRIGYTRLGAGGNQWPVAVATGSAAGGDIPLEVQFSSVGSLDPDGSIASFEWNFGDGNSSTLAEPAHTFTTPGNYVVTLEVMDTEGATTLQTIPIQITAPNQLPIAAASAYPLGGLPPLDVTFYASGSYDPDGSLGNFHWVFSTGSEYWGPTAYESFPSAGVYQATLTVFDNRGASASDTIDIYVGQPNQIPVAVATADPMGGDAPLLVNFSSAGSYDLDGEITAYVWDFDDGSSSTLPNPAHTFSAPGNYIVSLTVTDNRSGVHTVTVPITVSGVLLPDAQTSQSAPGETVTYTVMAQYFDQGNSPAADFDVTVVISGAQWGVDAPVNLAISPGGSAPLVVVVHVPSAAEAGQQSTAIVTLTSQANPAHTDTILLSTTIPHVGGIELSPLTANGSGVPGSLVTYTLTLTNIGSLTQTYAITVVANWQTNAAVAEVTLVPGGQTVIWVTVLIPDTASPGDQDSATIQVTSATAPGVSAIASFVTHAAPPIAHSYTVYFPLTLAASP